MVLTYPAGPYACIREHPIIDDVNFMAQGIDYFADHLEVREYLRWRATVVTSLAVEIQAVVPSRTKLYFLSLLTPDNRGCLASIFKKSAKSTKGIVVCYYDTDAPRVGEGISQSREVAPSTTLLTGSRVFYPEVHDKAELNAKVSNAKKSGTEGIVFYNYGFRKNVWIGFGKPSKR